MKKKIIASVIATLLSSTALADTASMNPDVTGMGLLQNEWVKAGINLNTGTFGSGGNTSPGLLFDPEGTGTFNPSFDYLTPGSPFDGFAVKVDGANFTNNNQGSTEITKTGEGLGPNAITWSGAVADKFQIDMNYSLLAGQPFVNGIATINMLTDATTLSFGKFIDPDSQGMPGDSSSTDNVLGYGVIPSTNVAFSEATVSRYALGIYTTDTNVTAGVNGWETDADAYNGTNYYKPLLDADGNPVLKDETRPWMGYELELDADGNPIPVNYGNSDDTIGISWTWTDVSAGDMLEASYAYIFGPSAFDAAEDAVTGGAGGGDTSVTSSWGTLTDVGSATDAAESGATGGDSTPDPEPEAPTVTDSDYASATYTDDVTAGTVGIIGTGTHAHIDDDGLYSTRTATFGGTLSMTRDSEVPTTWSNGTSTTETVSETFTRTVSGTHSDVMTDYTMNWDSATHSDGILPTAPIVSSLEINVADDYSTRTATGSVSAEITRTSIVPTDFTYDRTTETTNADDFDDASGYADTTTTETTTSEVSATYNLTRVENYTQTIAVSVNDVMTNSIAGDSTRVSQGYDSSTYVDTITVEVSDVNNTATFTVTGERTGEEVYEVTTPTEFTYDRTVTTTVANDFAPSSAYADSTTTDTATSTVSETYDIVTEAREDRVGGVIVTATSDSNQGKVVLDLQKNLARGTTFGELAVEGFDHNYGIYSGRSNLVKLGGTKDLENGLTVGAGIHIANSNIKGNTGGTDIESTQFGATVSKNTDGWDLSGTVQHTETTANISSTPRLSVTQYGTDLDISSELAGIEIPTIPSINAKADSSNTSVSFLAKGPGETFRPIIGGTLGKEEVDSVDFSVAGVSWSESGKDDTYGYATVGGELKLGLATLTALHHTDGVNQVSLGIEKNTDKLTWNIRASRTMTELGDTNSITAGINWKF